MKRILLAMLCAVLMLSLSGCFGQKPSYENIETAQAVSFETVSYKDYKNDLDGLVKYLQALNYLPSKTDPTEMLSEVIGAKKGYRYIYNVDNSNVVCELYEFDTEKKNENAARVIAEIKETGSFHLFGKDEVDKDVTYSAVLSDTEKYMMIYTDGSNNEGNVVRKKETEKSFKGFYSNKTTEESSKTGESSETEESSETGEGSKTEESSKAA